MHRQILVDLDKDPSGICTKLGEICDRAMHCPHVQVTSFPLLLQHSYGLVLSLDNEHEKTPAADALDEYDAAHQHVLACFFDYLDDHKEKAFSAAFLEPAKFLFSNGRFEGYMTDNVDTHALNWSLSLLQASLQIHVPLMATYWDDFPRILVRAPVLFLVCSWPVRGARRVHSRSLSLSLSPG